MEVPISVTKLPILNLAIMFLFYIISHWLIGVFKTKLENKENKTDEDKHTLKITTVIFKWYPAVIVIIYILILMS